MNWENTYAPDGRSAAAHAAEASRCLVRLPGGSPDVWGTLEDMGWRVRLSDLRAPEGGLQALLAPKDGGGFWIWVDDRPCAREAESGHPSRSGRSGWLTQFRLAHEWGHSLFFNGESPPRRRTNPTPEEEAFCDDFALHVLGGMGVTSAAP